MLDHLAEYYLEGRNFDLAYKTFEDAIFIASMLDLEYL